MSDFKEVEVNGQRVLRLLDPEKKADKWSRYRVVVNEPEGGYLRAGLHGELTGDRRVKSLADSGVMIRTEVGRSRWQRRARVIGHRWRRNLQSGAFVTVEPVDLGEKP